MLVNPKNISLGTMTILLALSLAIAACGPATSETATPVAGDTTGVEATPAVTEEEVATATPEPVAEKTVVYGVWNAPKTFNPWATNDSYSWIVIDMMFHGLARLDGEGKPIGALAESWDISDDGKVYTFHLRENAKWHDGQPVTAEDAVFTFERILNSVFASRYSTITGAAEFQDGTADTVAGLEAVDATTFRMSLDAPTAPLLGHMAIQAPILPKHLLGDVPIEQLETAVFFQEPIGNGPFKFVEYESGQYVELEAFEDFYLGPPSFEKLFLRIGTQDVLQAQLETGEVDVTAVQASEAERVRGLSGVTVYAYTTSIVQAININLDKPYLADVRVRQAMAYALNKDQMVATILLGYGETIDGPLASPDWALTDELATYPYDPEKAKSLLEEAGWDPNQGIVLRYPTGNKPRENNATLIQQAFKEVGIEVELQISDFATMVEDATNGDFDILLLGNQSIYDPDYIASQYLSYTHPPDGVNYMRYVNPRVDELLEQGRTTTSIEDRAPLYAEFQVIVTQELPKIFMYVDPEIYGVRDRIGGIEPLTSAGLNRSLYWNIFEWEVKE